MIEHLAWFVVGVIVGGGGLWLGILALGLHVCSGHPATPEKP